ncbi:MAG: hypothetical protein ACW96U_06715, partial [Candidatus Heimdallarchaeaceae archaeon]
TTDGLLKTTYIQLQEAGGLQGNNNDTITAVEVFSGGRSIYKMDKVNMVAAGANNPENANIQRYINQEPLNMNQAIDTPAPDYMPRICVINWDDIRLSSDLNNNIAGGLNASDLPNLSIKITKSANVHANATNDIRITHEQLMFEQIDSNTGIIAVSNRN